MATAKIEDVTLSKDDESFTVWLHDGRAVEISGDGEIQFWDCKGYMGSIEYPATRIPDST